MNSRMQAVQDPIIPMVAAWTKNSPGTISLGQGIVSYPPPPSVFDAIATLDPMVHRYHAVQGLPALREVILQKLHQENQIQLSGIEQIVVTAGSNMGFMNAILAITHPGDEIIIQSPYYFNHEMAIRMASCSPVLIETTSDYQLDLDRIEAAITPRTKAIVTISPNNPTGAVYSAAALRQVNQICQAHNLFHISDEAYEYFVYGNEKHCSPAQFDPNSHHTISLFSLSKAYGFAGWRIGYMVIPESLRIAVQKIQDTILICPALVSQVGALAALEIGRSYPAPAIAQLRQVRDSILQKLKSTNCPVITPGGAFYVFLKVPEAQSALVLVQELIEQYKVALIPGSAFGVSTPCALRIAYGALDAHTVDEGIDRLVKGLTQLRG